MRLLLGISLVVVLSACGSEGGAGRADEATPSSDSVHASPSVSLDTALADAAEDLASSLPSAAPRELSDTPDAPDIPTGAADATITADADDYRVESAPEACSSIWRTGRTLPSPYEGCTDGALLVAAEGRQGPGGVSYSYDGLCAGAGERIRRC